MKISKKNSTKKKLSETKRKVTKEKNVKIIVDDFAQSDIKQILYGTYSPLNRFMDLDEIKSVLNQNHLRDGSIWTLPIVLPIKNKQKVF